MKPSISNGHCTSSKQEYSTLFKLFRLEMRRNSWQDRVKLPSQQFGRSGTSGKLGFCQAVTTAYINTYGKTRLLVGITRTHLLVYCGRSVVNIFPPQALSSIISYTCYRQFDLSQQTQVKTKVVTRFKPCLAYCSLKMFSDQGIRSDLEATMEPHASCGGHGTLEILEIIESLKNAGITCCIVGLSALKYYGARRLREV